MQQLPILLDTPRLESIIELNNNNQQTKNKTIHKHESTEIFFIQEGKGQFLVGQEIISAKRGDLVLIHPFVEHETISSVNDSIKGFSLTFTHLHISELPKGHFNLESSPVLLGAQTNHMAISKYLEDIHTEHQDMTFGSQEIINSLLTAFIILILRSLNDNTNNHSNISISEKAIKYISQNYNKDLSLSELADVIFVSPYHLAHTFKNEIGISPIQYLIQYRIDEAKKMLLHSNLSIQEISYKVGYHNATYFNLIFKKTTGLSPGKFRKNNR
ncbi:AraC family transcriptional regulator [Ammoniphilus sp. YIM 78166]|uniref:AraC family transcriptional regulator n=1 Tax=Ammoniphilus sp. YIM 78166 TaxID=1644106 RepID=UPI0014307054|nr:AraC family transcriptional regulator [Ammoniphilus sp. YIM 78166]